VKFSMPTIYHDQEGFECLASLYSRTRKCLYENIRIDMMSTDWFDADMCAAFGAILYRLGDNLNSVSLTNIPGKIEEILLKNGFLGHYGWTSSVPDHWGTTVPYKRFDIKDSRYFFDYIDNEFIHRSEIPEMSARLLKKFRESVFEIFNNAVQHSNTKLGVFSCGQFFPNRDELNFMVVDLGIGIRKKVRKHIGQDIAPEKAIEWATKERNTTKRSNIPGGLGLKLLCEFIDLNGGRIQIVSDAGYWCREDKRSSKSRLDHPFPGTAVSIKINTADTHSYHLSSELRTDDIF